ncbi:TonB-dependent receptor [Exilibacterium tricleocarpae]|uniref:TonB-dependent receptor n=1 Tax=Exilibacterium tricleocarpae TaxID=2591008 RepID=A0A545U3L8_9GAMM|nr:TonB-dependent receptor [Exilibacterium tricleocarpae]TQV84003.1 TonB-dependent receptor [Exilibacterium tricleocarpae]
MLHSVSPNPLRSSRRARVYKVFAVYVIGLLAMVNPSFGAKLLVQFDLTPGPLSQSLIQFAEQAEVSLLVSKTAVAHLHAAPLNGVMTPSQALQRLLRGTGLGYRFVDRQTVSISAALLEEKKAPVASEPRVTAATTRADAGIEEVLVTAQRTSQNLQKVPVAVSVLNRVELERADIKDLTDLGTRVPGLTVASYSLGQPTIHMRGIGSNDDGAAMDNSVAVFVDDIYVGRITHIDLNILDLERVEVLRGPQGTLYGKNAIGGAIKLVSKTPAPGAYREIKLSSGNYNYRGVSGILNGPLGSTSLLGRLSFDSRQRDGWQQNLTTGERQQDDNKWALRGKLLYRPQQHLEAHWSLDGSRENLNASGRIPVHSRVPLRILDAGGNPIPRRDAQGQPLFNSTPEGDQPLYETRLPTDIFRALGGDPRHATNDGEGFTDRYLWGATQRLVYDSGGGTLTAITGYRDGRYDWAEESTGLPSSTTDQFVDNAVLETHRQFSQELRWARQGPANQSLVMGLYYLNEYTHRDEKFPFQALTARSDQRNTTRSYALFGELRYPLSPSLALNLGGRYSYDTKVLRQRAVSNGAPGVVLEDFQLKSEGDWDDFSPRLALSYQFSDSVLWYGSITSGMKSGGFQGAPGTLASASRTIEPESAWDYEAGFKSQWLQDRLRLNVAAFYTDYRDLQVVQFRTIDNFGLFETDNAASASLRGLEAEFVMSPSTGLTVSGSYAFLRATYDNYNDPEGRDFTGNHLRQAPKHSAHLALQYRRPVFKGELHTDLAYRYQSQSFREPSNSGTRLPAFRLVDGSITYSTPDRRWQASLWGKNLLDEEYISHLYVLGGNDYALYGTPRTYGVSIAWRFH